eukprot:TRINITY_DN50943_c0_g1_i1.p1 TRINITY_DN50943_c0_g1~~TRINITY_DN50943_c0_g1_i1.p1  ORF type:complete len:278 (-),score=39.12 TRINITY_DN50943_c0_g1_i1:7-819(-)
MGLAELPPCFHLVLSPPGDRVPRGRVVLLHGWLQCHQSWLSTATVLRDKLHLEVLLLDFYNHGSSPTLRERSSHSVEMLCRQVRLLVLHLGWQEDPLTVAGCSMGGAVALHYFCHWPENVRRLVLVAAAGLEESAWIPSTWGRLLATAMLGRVPDLDPRQGAAAQEAGAMLQCSLAEARSASPLARVLARLTMVTTTPDYRVPADIIRRLQDAKVRVTVVTGGLDQLHTPQLHVWRQIPGVKIMHHPWLDHTMICTRIFSLRLWEDPHIW